MSRAANKKNPSELLIFGNPKKHRKRCNAGTAHHKPGCKCFACKYKRGENLKTKTYHTAKRAKASGRLRTSKRSVRSLRRNPSDSEQAVKLFESFHGKDAQEVLNVQRSSAMRLDYTSLGDLVALGFDDCGFSESKLTNHWDDCPHISFKGDKVKLASSPNGRQLYFIGGSQNLDSSLSDFKGVDTQKDLIDLGDVFFVVYEARKVHSNFESTEWMHAFGKKGENLPRLVYDKLKKELALVGGKYFISTKAGVSPGIEG